MHLYIYILAIAQQCHALSHFDRKHIVNSDVTPDTYNGSSVMSWGDVKHLCMMTLIPLSACKHEIFSGLLRGPPVLIG